MKPSMIVKAIDISAEEAENVPDIFRQHDIDYQKIRHINWEKTFPYAPSVSFAIAHTQSAILLHFKVKEKGVLGNVTNDFGNVWEDACVEFFFSPENDGTYYNIECNCLGYVLMGAGKERPDRTRLTAEIAQEIKRWSSFGRSAIDYVKEERYWEIALVIPYRVFVNHTISSLSGQITKGNFYKCGGKDELKHYLTWSPVKAEKPDFHRPECFGNLYFE